MKPFPTHLEPLRFETFPYIERYAQGISPLGPVCYFDSERESKLPPLVLVHALGLNMTLWEYVAPVLACHTRVVGLDLPGCGRSAKPRHRYRLHDMNKAVLGLMDHLGLRRAILLGHSYGGRICAELALEHPDRVAGLVLMNASGFTTWPRYMHLGARLIFHPPVIHLLVRATYRFILSSIFATRNDRTERFVRTVQERFDTRYGWDFAHYVSPMIGDMMSHVLDRLDQLTLPVLVLWGTEDNLLRFREVSSWVSRLPDARLVSIPNCGHMPNLEHPETVNRAVIEFLERFCVAETAAQTG